MNITQPIATALFELAAFSERGRRKENQDNYLLVTGDGHAQYLLHEQPQQCQVAHWPTGHVRLVIADGMGGHAGGREAAEAVIQAMLALPFQSELHILQTAISEMHQGLHQQFYQGLDTAGSTLILADISPEGRAVLGHVGDSRAYRWQATQWQQLTQDHTLAEFAWRDGELDAETYQRTCQTPTHGIAQAMIFGSSGIIAEAGVKYPRHHPELRLDPADVMQLTLHPGDCLCLASDGLWAHTEDNQIHWPAPEAQIAFADFLQVGVLLALREGSRDNLTVVGLRWGS